MAKARVSIAQLSPAEEERILAKAAGLVGVKTFFPTLEELLTSPEGFGLTTATPLQRAICRMAEGLPLGPLAAIETVRDALNGANAPDAAPAELVVLSGIRTAKSMLAAALALQASQKCDLSMLAAGEIPRYSVLSLSLDNAKVIMGHLVGALQKPRLKHLRIPDKQASQWRELIDESSAESAWSIFLWHPSGRPVEIRVVAGKKAGGSTVSRWSAGATLDEAARMSSGEDAVINYDDTRRALLGRLLPGAQLISISSPWAPWGPIYDLVQKEWGRPVPGRLVIKAPGPAMNPVWWTPDRCEQLRQSDPTAFKTDVLAEFADIEEALIPSLDLTRATRPADENGIVAIPYEPRCEYVAAMDPATRGNAWTLVIATKKGDKKRVVYTQQWIGNPNAPLSPRAVLAEISDILRSYKLEWCYTDQWSSDALRDLAQQFGLFLLIENWTEVTKVEAFLTLAQAFAEGKVEIPDDPALIRDLRLIKKIPTQRGLTIRLPSTADGRHCDYAPAVARALFRWISDERFEEKARSADEEILLQEEQLADKVKQSSLGDWWEFDPFAGDGGMFV